MTIGKFAPYASDNRIKNFSQQWNVPYRLLGLSSLLVQIPYLGVPIFNGDNPSAYINNPVIATTHAVDHQKKLCHKSYESVKMVKDDLIIEIVAGK